MSFPISMGILDTTRMRKMESQFAHDEPAWRAMQDFKVYADQWNENRPRKRRCFDFYYLRRDDRTYMAFYCQFVTTHSHIRTYEIEPEFKVLDPPPFSVYAEKLRASK